MRRTPFGMIHVLLLVAWALTLALWRPVPAHNDEAYVLWAIRTHDLPGLIATGLRLDGQPPLYPFLLWVIQQIPFFHSVPMLYFASLLLAFPFYPLMFRLARSLGGEQAGTLLLALLAFNPFLASLMMFLRAYPLTLMLGALTLWLAVRADRRPTPARGLAWGLAGLALFSTFYYGIFLIAAAFVWLLRRPREDRRWRAAWLGAAMPGLAVALWAYFALAPAIGIVIRHQGNPGIHPGPLEIAANVWLTLWSGWAADARFAVAAGSVMLLILAWALIPAIRRRVPALGFLLLAGGLPLAGFLLAGWRYNFFAARYAAVALPALLLALALILVRSPRRVWALAIGCAGLLGLIGLSRTILAYTALPENNPWYAEVAATLLERVAPGEVVVVQAPWHYQALLMYAPNAPWRLFDLNEEARWREALRDRPVVWLLGVPAYRGNWKVLERALAGWIRTVEKEWPAPADAALVRYVSPPETPSWRPLSVSFEGGLVLEAAASDLQGPPGILRVGLKLRATAPISQAYTVFVHLLDPAGRWITGSDAEPPIPTSAMQPGTSVTLWRALQIPTWLPAGAYAVTAGAYPTGSNGWPRLRVQTGEDTVRLGTVSITPRPAWLHSGGGRRCGGLTLNRLTVMRLTPYQQEGPDIFPEPGCPDRLRAWALWRVETPGVGPPELIVETDGGFRELARQTPPALDVRYFVGETATGVWEVEIPPDLRTRRLIMRCPGGEAEIPAFTLSRRRWHWNYSWVFWNRMP